MAFILVLDMNGKQIRKLELISKGNNNVNIKGIELSPGMYLYSMFVDGKVIGTKRMLLTE